MTRRVLWLSHWLRPLARVHCESLREQGFDVVLVTSDQHPESDAARDYEWVIEPSFKQAHTWRPFGRVLARARRFDPDVVVTELVRDPRWIALGALAPRVRLVHDDRPHDASELRPWWERTLFDRWEAGATRTVAFSKYVGAAVGADDVVPLTSDLDPARVPPVVPAADRRDFVLIGRLNEYKNLPVVLAAWRRHVAGPGWRGDDLVLLGNGSVPGDLGPRVRWVQGSYSYADVIPTLAAAKGSIAHYRRASQSGVQVLSMQLGVVPIVSTEGALPEFQPPGEPAIGVDDVDGLVRVFDALADPVAAAARGADAERDYRHRFAADVAGRAMGAVLDSVAGQAAASRRDRFGRKG